MNNKLLRYLVTFFSAFSLLFNSIAPFSVYAVQIAESDVDPIFECWEEDPNSEGKYIAHFGWENHGEAVHIGFDEGNNVTPNSYQSYFPEDFGVPSDGPRPGRTPFYPDTAIQINDWDGSNIVWGLPNHGTETASLDGPKCPEPPVCEPGEAWVYSVEEVNQGLRKDGNSVEASRSEEDKVKGEDLPGNDNDFFSLGKGGSIVVGYEFSVENISGDDFTVYETTWNDRNAYTEETALVEVSQDKNQWFEVGTASGRSTDGESSFDFGPTGLSWIKYIKLTDTTNFGDSSYPAAGDGFDVDAINVFNQLCENLEPEPTFPTYACQGTIYAANNSGNLSWVDTASGEVNSLDSLSFGSSASADDPFNPRTYYINRYGEELAYYDHSDSSNNPVGSTGVTDVVFTKLAFNKYGELYGLTDDHDLYEINVTTGVATPLGEIAGLAGGDTGGDIVFTESDLYLIGRNTGNLYTVNIDTLSATLVKDTELGAVTGLAYLGGYFYVSTTNSVYKMDTNGENVVPLSSDQEEINDLSSCLPGEDEEPEIPRYGGENQCPAGTYKGELFASVEINGNDEDGEFISDFISGNPYLFEVSGTFIPTSASGYESDAGYTTINGTLASQYGIQGTPPDLGAHALLGDLGGGVGLVNWGDYNEDHFYERALTPTSNDIQLLVGDRYDSWFDTSWNDQAGMNDNSGSLHVDIYECAEPDGQIQGRKYSDVNKNGDFDNNEKNDSNRLDDWTINLFSAGWEFIKSMETGDDSTEAGDVGKGQYRFENLAPGGYYVCEVPQDGWVQTEPLDGVENNDSRCHYVELELNEVVEGVQFGNFKLGAVQGRKYQDDNLNGFHDFDGQEGEERMDGWTIRLYDSDWEELEEVVTSNTGEIGQYRFEGLDTGTYYTCEVLEDGWAQTGPNLGEESVDNEHNPVGTGVAVENNSGSEDEGSICWQTEINESGQENGWLKFGNAELGTISGYKWNDGDGNGERNNESGLSGWDIVVKPFDLEALDILEIDSGNAGGANSSVLVDGRFYLVELEGVWYNFQNNRRAVDAEYYSDDFDGESWFSFSDVADEEGRDIRQLDVVINDQNVDWGSFSPEHLYKTVVEGEGNSINLRVYDEDGAPAPQWFNDNDGALEARIYDVTDHIYTTDSDGYYEAEVEPGDYQVLEILKDGWVQTYPSNPSYHHVSVDPGDEVAANFGNHVDAPFRILASKVVCDEEPDLPNWGNGGVQIDADTAEDYVSEHPSCRIETDWQFQWAPAFTARDMRDEGTEIRELGDELGEPWVTFTGEAIFEGDLSFLGQHIEVREIIPDNSYVSFDMDSDYGAEIYCTGDVKNYDNVEWVRNPQFGQTAYCVGFNALQTGSISGLKFDDDNENGLFDVEEVEIPEQVLSGWTIFLDEDGDQELDEGEVSTVTGEDGTYIFEDLLPGTYSVCEVINEQKWYQTEPGEKEVPGCHAIVIEPNSDVTETNFGNNEIELGLDLVKSNDADGTLGIGDIITYTLEVTNTGNQTLDSVTLKDAPPGGLLYVTGSTELNGSAYSDPTDISGQLTWEIGELAPGAENSKTLTYQMEIGDDVTSGDYTNLAVATGIFVLGEFEDDPEVGGLQFFALGIGGLGGLSVESEVEGESIESDPADSTIAVNIPEDIGGQVLGASVLGAATEVLPLAGSDTALIVLILGLGFFGAVLKIVGTKLEKKKNV